MHPREGLGEVAIALVGDDHAGAGLGDEEVAAGDADIRLEELLAQHRARFAHQARHGVRGAARMIGLEQIRDLFAGLVDRR